MSSSMDIHVNGNENGHHDHILRPRAIKPTNRAIQRTLSEDGLSMINCTNEVTENGTATGQTRHVNIYILDFMS